MALPKAKVFRRHDGRWVAKCRQCGASSDFPTMPEAYAAGVFYAVHADQERRLDTWQASINATLAVLDRIRTYGGAS